MDKNAHAIIILAKLDACLAALTMHLPPNCSASLLRYFDVYVDKFIVLVQRGAVIGAVSATTCLITSIKYLLPMHYGRQSSKNLTESNVLGNVMTLRKSASVYLIGLRTCSP